MSKELLNQTIKLFSESNSSEKWNSFLEIAALKEQVKERWFGIFKSEFLKYFSANVVYGWKMNDNNTSWCWYLEEFDQTSISVWFEGYNKISLYVNKDKFDIDKIKNLLDSDKYGVLFSVFNRIDARFSGGYIAEEVGNFLFHSIDDGHFTTDKIAWHAGNNTQRLLEQVVEKIDKIRKDPQITKLIRELNEETEIK